MRQRVLLELRRPVEALAADGALVGIVFGVHRDDVALQVTGVGALVVAVRAVVRLVLLVRERVLQQLLLLGEGLEAALALVGHLLAVLGLDVGLQVRRVRRLVVAVQAGVRLLARVRAHVLLELRRVAEALAALHADVREALAVHGQQVAVEQALLRRLIVTKLALVHLVGGRRRGRLALGLAVVVLQSVGEQRRLLVELLAAHLALEGRLAAQRVHLHVVVETHLLVGGEVAVGALVLLAREHLLVVVFGVALQEASRLELLPAQHAGVDSEGLAVGPDDDGWSGTRRGGEKESENMEHFQVKTGVKF